MAQTSNALLQYAKEAVLPFYVLHQTNTPEDFKLRPEQHVLFARTVGYPA